MDGDNPDADEAAADRVYAAPASAQAEAAEILADSSSSAGDKVEALWTLGRAAYYSNRVSDSVVYLREALPLVDEPAKRADLVLTLAPALSKVGRTGEALELLDPEQDGLSARQQGQLHNQRGILFTEHGQLPESVDAFELAIGFLRDAGDTSGEARALVNIGASVSMMGDQDEAERWYELGWELAVETGQEVVAAGIEGNLGYVASRRGDFAAALDWYERARKRFAELGDVDLLVAVLETDHATTLLDVGLDADAADAARYAVESSRSGGNRMLEVQARVLFGEAQLRLNRHRHADSNLRRARESANDLGVRPWALRSDYLRLQLATQIDQVLDVEFAAHVRDLAEEVLEAGWARESLRATHIGALALARSGESAAALELLDWARANIDLKLADPIDVEFMRALTARLRGDRAAQQGAIEAGLAEVDRQRSLLGAAELQVLLGHRARSFRDLAVAAAIDDDDPEAALLASEASRNRTTTPTSTDEPETDALLADLRDLRVSRSEAQLSGADTSELDQRIRNVENEILNLHRRAGGAGGLSVEDNRAEVLDALRTTIGTSFVCFVRTGDELCAVRARGGDLALVGLGDANLIANAVRAQRSALRRMASADSSASEADIDLVARANEKLDRLLIDPLELARSEHIVIVPARIVSGLGWSGLPSLADSVFTIAPSMTVWAAGPSEVNVSSVGLLGGPQLEQAEDELNELLALWGEEMAEGLHRATTAEAFAALGAHDAVHMAAHGTFRSDNPYFSAIEFDDGPLTLLDFERLPRLPEVVVLASCDGAAAAGGAGSEVVGTTSTMLALGASVVVAPTVAVDDGAARRFSIDLHRSLVDGIPVANAVCEARQRAVARGTPADAAVAQSFQVHGNRAASHPINILRI